MASILNVNGRWRALIRRKGHPSQCRTFATKSAAESWARKVESEIDHGRAVSRASRATVGEVIQAYRELRERTRPIADTSNEHYMLKALDRLLADKIVAELKPDDLVAYALTRKDEGAGPYTINMDLSKLGTVLRYGGAAMGTPFPDVVGAARPSLTYLRLIGGGGKRERRPTQDELEAILAYFAERHGQDMRDCVEFAALTAMRRGELTAITWADVDEAQRVITVARKHPRKGKVIERVPILGRAWEVLQRQKRDPEDDRIFRFSHSTLSKYFTWACKELSIPDLHLHDLRHEGTSRLFEQGLEIQEVALVTGHKDWRNLRRYTNLAPEKLHAVYEAKTGSKEGSKEEEAEASQ